MFHVIMKFRPRNAEVVSLRIPPDHVKESTYLFFTFPVNIKYVIYT